VSRPTKPTSRQRDSRRARVSPPSARPATLKIAVYGKGGIGKSTFTACLAAGAALAGRKVLHVGCDPKHDSTLPFLEGREIPTLADILFLQNDRVDTLESFLVQGRLGIDCVESGGPEPGLGCAGRGIARMFEIFEAFDIFSRGYDLALFDVLGDVVCSGFSGPMRRGWADRIVVVTSEEFMSLYAANNICRAIQRLERNGVRLAGFVINRRDNDVSLEPLEEFAGKLGGRILGVIPRDPRVRRAEVAGVTVLEDAPDAPASSALREILGRLLALTPDDLTLPRPMTDREFRRFVSASPGRGA
jgi:nitrogenase iron protein